VDANATQNQFNTYEDEFVDYDSGIGVSQQSQYELNFSTQNYITKWTQESNSLITATENSSSLVTNNYIYILGGYNNDYGHLNKIQRVSFDKNGNLTSTWNNAGTIPLAMYGMGYIIAKGRYYLIGGDADSGILSTVYSVPINRDGSLGLFRDEIPLPAKRSFSVCFIIKDKLYVVGGYNGDKFVNTVYRTTINNEGVLVNWEVLNNFPVKFCSGKPLFIKDRIYIFGAYDGSTYTKIYYTTFDANGDIGSWIYVSDMPQNIAYSSIVCTDNYVFSIGGYNLNNSQTTRASYRAPILPDGSIGDWVKMIDAPIDVHSAQSVIIGNKIYLIGGFSDGNDYVSNVYSVNINNLSV